MNALLNAHIQQGGKDLFRDRLSSLGVQCLHAGESSGCVLMGSSKPETLYADAADYVPHDGYDWYVLRVTYNRILKAQGILADANVQTYVPMHYVIGKDTGNERVQKPLLPNLFFVYGTRKMVDSIVKKKDGEPSIIKFYLDKTKPMEVNGKHPPLTIPYVSMMNFIKATNTENEHVRVVYPEQCHYKSGDTVKVVAGEFSGVVGKVARIAGQQRVVVEISGLCLVATAYIPSDFIRPVENK